MAVLFCVCRYKARLPVAGCWLTATRMSNTHVVEQGVSWSDGRVQELTLIGSKLGLSPHIEQLQTLAQLCLYGCPLK